MHARAHQFSNLRHGEFPEFASHAAHIFRTDAEKPVPAGIFEIPAINLRPGWIGEAPQRAAFVYPIGLGDLCAGMCFSQEIVSPSSNLPTGYCGFSTSRRGE